MTEKDDWDKWVGDLPAQMLIHQKYTFYPRFVTYLLFGYNSYYPIGGWDDFLEMSPDLEVLRECMRNTDCSYYHIVEISDSGNGCVAEKIVELVSNRDRPIY